ncbi:helix-turn-helix domain-containing protein [Nocardia aurantia]|uniref:HTH cro/C1-type domain-containing protein n=1 Tax=Nocardia aurantia TaxID=2585199 RepID=A0A7K0DG13_9NOCA|nr:helix-turn-helix transcriptional regulator [Nocardia aurantia]MQY24599.1 hypothetical protein [Nocardia aurantia]
MNGSYFEAREALGARLRELRQLAGLSGADLARLCGWHQTKVPKLEYGRIKPSPDDIRAYCTHCDTADELPDLLASLNTLELAYLEVKKSLSIGTRRRQRTVLRQAEQAEIIRIFSPNLVPGFLQTAEYARAILAEVVEFYQVPNNDIDEGVSIRLERQQLLYKREHRFHFLIGEAALHTRVGDDAVMLGQLDRLLAVVGLPRVVVGMIPFRGAPALQTTNFTMYDNRVVNVEAVTAELTVTQPREIALYGRAFDLLASKSVIGEHARALICAALDDLAH